MRHDLKSSLSYARFAQMSFILTFGLGMYLFTTIPHNWWIFLTVLMMMSAVQPGLILVKSINRGKGTIVGIILAFSLVYVLHLNYRFVSIIMIMAMILLNIPTPKRYDLTVTAMTIMIFLSDSYNFKFPLLEGPIEVAINRITCTIIGIAICISADHFLFNRFNYSGKVYSSLQHELLQIIQQRMHEVMQEPEKQKNSLVLIKSIRDSFNIIFTEISNSGAGILNSHTTSPELKQQVQEFSDISWRLRMLVSAVYFANCVLKDRALYEEHIAEYNKLLGAAKQLLIKV